MRIQRVVVAVATMLLTGCFSFVTYEQYSEPVSVQGLVLGSEGEPLSGVEVSIATADRFSAARMLSNRRRDSGPGESWQKVVSDRNGAFMALFPDHTVGGCERYPIPEAHDLPADSVVLLVALSGEDFAVSLRGGDAKAWSLDSSSGSFERAESRNGSSLAAHHAWKYRRHVAQLVLFYEAP